MQHEQPPQPLPVALLLVAKTSTSHVPIVAWAQPEPSIDFYIQKDLLLFLLTFTLPSLPSPQIPTPLLAE